MHSKIIITLWCAIGVVPLTATAQRPGAADPAATAPAPEYRSAFSTYKPFQEQSLGSWRDLNDEVAKAGGHVGIFGGAGHAGHAGAKAAPSAPKAAAPAPEATGQPPMRGAPAAPAAKPHH